MTGETFTRRDGSTVPARYYDLEDGTKRLGPILDDDADRSVFQEMTLVGFAYDGSPVVALRYDEGADAFFYGLSTCCWASDKGTEYGVVCRACYHDFEGTSNIFRPDTDVAVWVADKAPR